MCRFSGIIAGGGTNMSPARGFLLSLCYVGVTAVGTPMGVLAAYIGSGLNLQAIFNQPLVLIPFALLFVVLASSMFGAFTIEMPSFIQSRLSDASNQQRAGTFIGVGVMGALSALIVSACVAPVLIGALTFIAKTGDMLRGGLAMLSISLGMGTPLLLVGASAGALLPRAGAWMETIKNLFGVMFLAVAVWLVTRIVSPAFGVMIWAIPLLALAWVLWRANAKSSMTRGALRAIAVVAALLAIGELHTERRTRRHQAAGAESAARQRPAGPRVQAHQDRRGPGARSRGSEGCRQIGDARLLCGLVRVLQRNGAQHVHRGRSPGGTLQQCLAAGRRDRQLR
jgi:thiol:disulfide interchange protein